MSHIPVITGIFYYNNMRAIIFFLSAIIVAAAANSQASSFPKDWAGNWKGELRWYKKGATEARTIPMELRIHPTASPHKWSWQLIYGGDTSDNRPYKLIAKDEAGIHWVIDENNGILLDQFWIGNTLCGSFTVQSSTILNSYRLENGRLKVIFYTVAAQPLQATGQGTADVPLVSSYQVLSYQEAELTRQ